MTESGCCDLCGHRLRGRWMRLDAHEAAPGLAARHLGAGVVVVGHWAACIACARLVGNRAWRSLVERVTRNAPLPAGPDEEWRVAVDIVELCTEVLPTNLVGPRAGRRAGPGWSKPRR
ncbi:MAG: hypothetical protein L0H64_17060 [Pseudonocardia sp.]|nr:hypothetical protein [Pseudonocardia sp.]